MRKGIIRIITGLILIGLQVLSIIGNSSVGMTFPLPVSTAQLMFDLGFYISYYFVGILGLILFVSGLIAFFDINTFRKENRYKDGKFQQPTDAVSARIKAKAKNRFCKHCGSPIDPATKKCNSCGKQYIRMTVLKKRGIIPKVVAVLSILILGLCVYRNVQYQKQITQMTTQIAEQNEVLKSLQSELESAKSDVSEIQDKYRAKFSEAYNLSQENDEMKRIYDYCEKNMVFVISKTYLYHKPHCFMIQGSEASFEGFTVSVAQQRGYTPCWLCCN